MNEKVITVSAGEVGSLIGVAAAEVSFEKQMSDEKHFGLWKTPQR